MTLPDAACCPPVWDGSSANAPRGLIAAVLAAAAGVVICSPADHTGYLVHSDGLRAGTRAADLGAHPGVAVIIGGDYLAVM